MAASPSSKAQRKFTLWKNRLLDLSHTNPQLYYNINNRDSVQILHPSMDTVFKIMVELGQTCTFPPIYKRRRENKKSIVTEDESNSENATKDANVEVIASIQDALAKRKGKLQLTELASNLDDDTLRGRLLKLQQRADSLEEEKGINPLYLVFGLLKWKDPVMNTEVFTPILYLPVKLQAESVNAPYTVTIIDDDVIINPHLREKLRTIARIDLPPFDDEIQMYSFREYMETFKKLILPEWSMVEQAYLTLFTGSKITLFNDMEEMPQLFLNHPIIRAIVEEQGYSEPPERIPSEHELSDKANPWDTFLVVDCDSSQYEAINFAKKGNSLVIQGPPGTGKSQCITNIIAECLGMGKHILFVAEKKAAIEVVRRRLESCGLGDFCLDIHSSSPKKAEIMGQLAHIMNLEYHNPPVRPSKYSELLLIRQRLNEYVELINRSRGLGNFSIFEMMGRDMELNSIPLLSVTLSDPFRYSEDQLVEIDDILARLETYRATMERYSQHPWASAKLGAVREDFKESLQHHLDAFYKLNEEILRFLPATTAQIQSEMLFEMQDKTDWERLEKRIRYWELIWPLWNMWQTYQYLLHNIGDMFDFESPQEQFEGFDFILHTIKLPSDINLGDFIKSRLSTLFDLIQKIIRKYERFNTKFSLHPISTIQDLQIYREFLQDYHPQALLLNINQYQALFEDRYKNLFQRMGGSYQKDKAEIMHCVRESAPNREINEHLVRIQEFQDFIGKGVDPSAYDELNFHITQIGIEADQIQAISQDIGSLFEAAYLKIDPSLKIWKENAERARGWLAHIDEFNEWAAVQAIVEVLSTFQLKTFFDALKDHQFPDITYSQLFRKVFTRQWLSKAIISEPRIENFDVKTHEKTLNNFITLDQEILLLNQERLRQTIFSQRPVSDLSMSPDLLQQSGFLKREAKKKKNIKSLRSVFSTARDYITMLKPCFMMSPLSVANFLRVDLYDQFFDLVIFDEASQVLTEDALGAILRGKQLIVVGDSQQLPPTQFFITKPDEDTQDLVIDEEPLESLLDECTGIGFREKLLRYHYRSRKEGLIAFSNAEFYDLRLYTFPDLLRFDTPVQGADLVSLPAIQFNYVKEGIYDNRKNLVEAKTVAQAIITHYKRNREQHTEYSLGVVAFSQSQQEAILHELELLYRSSPELEFLVKDNPRELLFVKNLENVQGDERDVMFISVGYARNPQGHIGLNFGPINQSGGYRRLNVIITRARYHVKVFCSFLPGEINKDKVQAEGLLRLLEYLEFARSGKLKENISSTSKKDISFNRPFESCVKNALNDAGFSVDELLGQSTFKIDLAVLDPQDPNRYLLALQCDGGSYRQATNARDRDRIRPQVLQSLGWTTFHIWAHEWYSNQQEIIKKIKQMCTEAKQKPNTPTAIPKIKLAPIADQKDIQNPPSIAIQEVEVDANTELPEDREIQPKDEIQTTSATGTTLTETKNTSQIEEISETSQPTINDRKSLFTNPEIEPYRSFKPFTLLSQGIFFAEESTARIEAIKKILAQEGPMHIEIFQKRVMELFDFKRTTPKIAERFIEIQSHFIIQDEFIALSSQTNPKIRICENPIDDPRGFMQIHPVELQNAMIFQLKKNPRMKKADLFIQTVKLFGFPQVRKNFSARLEPLLDKLVKLGEAQIVGNYVQIHQP